ncbi:NAD(P)-binding protein [Alkalibaculum sp. M08DMB]|uniref:NAD(P)-binding protein n=1 Tax=Alkalibaculum sporogenes TaxID=2655001 RepID=A0A6A7KCT7_9FIRM|nr:FAD-dependent oxidoreductase [Alkalibaculum sporogenes]MPW27162.1 NAD(P)-binding protein [Alkalibaculum sporogenes]
MFENLFAPGRIGTMETRNRIVLTPMGNYMANPDGTVSDVDIAFYGKRAKGGVGVVFTECAVVDERGKGNTHQICVYDDKYMPGLTELANEIHKYNSKVVVQIYHPGRQGISVVNGNKPMAAPSDIPCKLVQQPTAAMTVEEIKALVTKFVDAAQRLQKSGIDGVEVHGAHGYLLNEFLSPYTNIRTDEYGGSLENRMRILEEIVTGIRERCGDYPIIVRLSVDEFLGSDTGLQLEESVKIAKRLEEIGVDCLNVSSGIYETMNVAWEPSSYEQGWKIYLSETIKKAVSIPVIGVAVIRDPEYADQMIKEGKLDFAGSARQHLADDHWGNKAQEGRPEDIRKCISCLHCMQTLMGADMGDIPFQCAINVQAGKELEYNDFKEDGNQRVVPIIGAGPAGLEAARILAKRNYKPVIFEKSNQVGGQLQLANKPPKKEKINWLINYLKTQVDKEGIEIKYRTMPTVADLEALNPYAVFVAQGSNPIVPKSIPGIDGENVIVNTEILSGNIKLTGKKIAVVGSGMTGLETAHLLAENKNEVHVFEMADDIGPGLYFQNLIDIMNHLGPLGVQFYPKHRLVKIENGCAVFEKTDKSESVECKYDYIVISLGTCPNNDMIQEIESKFDNVRVLGDAKNVGKIRNAIESGFLNAYQL